MPKTAAAEEAEEAIWHVASARGRTTAHVCALQWSNAVAEEPNLTAQNADDARNTESTTSALSESLLQTPSTRAASATPESDKCYL